MADAVQRMAMGWGEVLRNDPIVFMFYPSLHHHTYDWTQFVLLAAQFFFSNRNRPLQVTVMMIVHTAHDVSAM